MVATISLMDRRRLVVIPATVALLLAAPTVWAGPPPPPPEDVGGAAGAEAGTIRNAPPPPPASAERRDTAPADPLVIDQRTPETDITSNWSYSRSIDRGPNYVRAVEDDPFFTINPVGYYQGVSVGGGNQPPYAPKEIGGQSSVLTWTGFERGEASSRVFFQLSSAIEPEVTVEAGRVLIKFPRTSVTVRNNLRGLITKYFKTPVDQVKLKRSGKDLIAVLELRWEATPSWRVEPGANGYRVLVVEFSDTQDQELGDDTAPTPPPPPAPPKPAGEDQQNGPFLPGG